MVADRIVVEKDQIDAQTLEAPVGMRQQELAGERQLVRFGNPRHHDRPIPGNAMPPQARLALTIGRHGSGGAQGRTRVEDVGCQTLVQVRLLGRQTQMAQLHLVMGPGQLKGAGHAMKGVILICQGQGFLPALGHGGAEGECDGAARRDLHPAAQADNRVEHGTGGARKDHATLERHRVSRRPAATEEPGPIRFELHVPRRSFLDGQDVHGPDRLLLGSPRPAAAQESILARQKLGFEEQLVKCRVGQVRGMRGEHHFRVTGHFHIVTAGVVVGHRQPADLGGMLGRYGDFQVRLDAGVEAAKFGSVRRVGDLVIIGRAADRLMAGRPDQAAAPIAQVEELPIAVPGPVLAPARHGEIAARAVTGTGVRHHDGVAAVG